MFFDDEDERVFNPDLFHVVHREFYTINSDLEVARYGLRSVPTHTEDGIPIRKLYVTNLPPKTTRSELFGVFAQYGFIKSCWLRIGEKGPNKIPSPTYAFITFSNPADAHKALQAPHNEKTLRGRSLRISPADSWHQPAEEADGRVRWKPSQREEVADDASKSDRSENSEQPDSAAQAETSAQGSEATTSEENTSSNQEQSSQEEVGYSILDVLNADCLAHILSYIPIRDLIRSERVSKRWQSMIQEYLQGIRIFKTSWWQHGTMTLTTAVLRRVLQRLGPALLRLHIDHHWSALNDRTAHTVGKFCPNLEELKVVGMYTKNWNPLIYGCKHLKSLSFISCNKLTDTSLVLLVNNESSIESLTVANNTHVTGLFLTGTNPSKLSSLGFFNCYSLQGTVLSAAIEKLPNLTTLKLDAGPMSLWKMIPQILKKLPRLEELSLSEYTSVEQCPTSQGMQELSDSLATLTHLKALNLSRNIYISNAVLKHIAQSCPKLETLNVSCCNSRRNFPYLGVGDEGIVDICRSCTELRSLDASYLAGLTDAGVNAIASCARLQSLTVRGSNSLTTAPFLKCLQSCHFLEELDLCGCNCVSEELAETAYQVLDKNPRSLTLRLASTAAAQADTLMLEEYPSHRLLLLDLHDDRCNPHLRPDFMDHIIDASSEDSLLYDSDQFPNSDDDDDDIFVDDVLDDYHNGLYGIGWGPGGEDILLL